VSKNRPLTCAEFEAFKPNEHVVERLESFARQCPKPRDRIRVLDWGCGRGRMVLSLRERGFDAYGVDLDPLAVKNGTELFRTFGHPSENLSVVNVEGRTGFSDDYFDFVLSNQVLEHVRDLPATVSELARVTRPGGSGLHVFPPRWHVREAHLGMPCVHWLPKNEARRRAIHLFATLGIESPWEGMAGVSLADRVDTYYRYSVDKTYYRSNPSIAQLFRLHGMKVRACTIDNPKLDRFPLVRIARRHGPSRALLNAGLATLVSAELSTRMESESSSSG